MHHAFKVGDKVTHRWTKKGYGKIVSMDEKRLMIEVEWGVGIKKEKSIY